MKSEDVRSADGQVRVGIQETSGALAGGQDCCCQHLRDDSGGYWKLGSCTPKIDGSCNYKHLCAVILRLSGTCVHSRKLMCPDVEVSGSLQEI